MLVTGMSGVGKQVALAELARRGHRVVDTDYGGWIENLATPEGLEPMWLGRAWRSTLAGRSTKWSTRASGSPGRSRRGMGPSADASTAGNRTAAGTSKELLSIACAHTQARIHAIPVEG